jgi:peptidoglycan/LPS O-acetylase OafA/YrhL
LPALDGLRGIAILLVMLYHLAPRSIPGGNLFGLGYCGVDLFFVLSGFLITRILLDAKSRPHYFRNFFSRRTLRIFPLYYGVLLFLFILLPLLHRSPIDLPRSQQLWFWFYASNIPDGVQAFPFRSLNHFWSLAVEEQFYLAWPFLVVLLSEKGLMRLCIAALLLAPCTRLILVTFSNMPSLAYTLMPCRMDTLAAGALIACAARQNLSPRAAALFSAKLWGVLAAALLILLAMTRDFSPSNPLMLTAGLSVLGLFFASTLAFVTTSQSIATVLLQTPVLRFFGRYSYGLYVYHPLVHGLLSRSSLASSQNHPWLLFSLSFLVTLATACLSFHLYESQFLKLKRYFQPPTRVSHPVANVRLQNPPLLAPQPINS